jgi:hypothetical protein
MDESSKESSGERQSQEPEAAKARNEKAPNKTPAGETSAGVPATVAPGNKAVSSGNEPPRAQGAGEGMLPVVWSPKLGGEEVSEVGAEEVLHATADEDTDASGEAAKEEAAASAAASPETTGTIPSTAPAASEAKSSEKVLQDWIVREARAGRALIENRQGGMFDITAGSVLPGLGRVESVKRQDGQWIVVTARGIIYSAP